MTARPVEAVFFWPLRNITTFRSIYGRLGSKGGYTKDFLQSPQAQQQAMDRVLGRTSGAVPVSYRWPGGHEPDGSWRESAVAGDNRGQLAWPHNSPPLPWRVGNPDADGRVTIEGDPTRTTAAQANAVHAGIVQAGTKPWLLAIKLRNEANVLHVRAYLEDPPAGLEDRGFAVLPSALRQAMLSLPLNQGGGSFLAREPAAPRATRLVERIQAALARGPNVLLVGPPGTGKTVALEDLRLLYRSETMFDPTIWGDAWTDEGRGDSRKTVSLVFHPSYSYENFVAGLVPEAGASGGFGLRTRAGPLLSMAHWASSPRREGLIVIDEFNRGAAAAAFGDMIALLDKDKRAWPSAPAATIERPYPPAPIDVEAEYAAPGGSRTVPDKVSLPLALKIVAAMNSSDRSVAPLDAALRRRFEIIEVEPDYEALARRLGLADANPAPHDSAQPWTAEAVAALALRLLRALNTRIGFILGKDFLLGQAIFWDLGGQDVASRAQSLAERVDERVVPMLRLTFIDQDEALGAALGIPSGGANALGRWEQPPQNLHVMAQARLRLHALSLLPATEQIEALATLARP
ncbi:MAG: 5-methylcytosine-specific restriction enzyme [Sphingomonadales bacterium]|jgi:5-methylcytosine-specific restriction protein B|nr:5-methylcytosine-specific restriction enzyme [Sphingomonadales bacterium]